MIQEEEVKEYNFSELNDDDIAFIAEEEDVDEL